MLKLSPSVAAGVHPERKTVWYGAMVEYDDEPHVEEMRCIWQCKHKHHSFDTAAKCAERFYSEGEFTL